MAMEFHPKQTPTLHDLSSYPVDEHTMQETPQSRTEDSTAERDAITHHYPTTPGSSTGEGAIEHSRGLPDFDYPLQLHPSSAWLLRVSVRRLTSEHRQI